MSENEIQQISEVLALNKEEVEPVYNFLVSIKGLLTNSKLHYYPYIGIIDEVSNHISHTN